MGAPALEVRVWEGSWLYLTHDVSKGSVPIRLACCTSYILIHDVSKGTVPIRLACCTSYILILASSLAEVRSWESGEKVRDRIGIA